MEARMLITVVFIALLSASNAYAATYYVSPSGSDTAVGTDASPWRTMQKAANSVKAGDTVNVKAGTYNENVNMVNSGTSGNPIVFEAEPGVTISGINIVDKSQIAFMGFNIAASGNAISLGNAHYIIIEDNTISSSGDDCIAFVVSQLSSNVRISGNAITGCGRGSVAIDLWGDRNIIEGNDITGITDDFTRVFGSWNVIRNNYFHDVTDSLDEHLDGVQTWCDSARKLPVKYNLVENNNMKNVAGGNAHWFVLQDEGAVCDMSDFILRYNIGNNVGSGFLISDDEVDHVKAYHNTINEHGAAFSPKGWTVLGIYGGSDYGAIINNIIKDSVRNGGEGYYAQSTGFQGHNNLGYLTECGASCTWSNPIANEAGFVKNKDPLLNSDLGLKAGSPAIDAGGPLTSIAAADSGSGTILIVNDAHMFQDGWAGVQPDWISVGSATNAAQIASIDYATNAITLAGSIPRNDNDPVYLYKDSDGTRVLYGNAPDIGAFEFVPGGTCVPSCTGKQCGSDGCVGSCGTCQSGYTCNSLGQCAGSCIPSCLGRQCGSDGCSGSCGVCQTSQTCKSDGTCAAATEIIIDNSDPGFTTTGTWPSSSYPNPYKTDSVYADVNKGAVAYWTPTIATPGIYQVYAWWTAGVGRVNDAKYTVTHSGGTTTVTVNQKQNGGMWNLLGTFTLNTGSKVQLSDASSDQGYIAGQISDSVCGDAIKIAYQGLSCHSADNDCDSCISQAELLNYIQSWKSGNVTLANLMEAIRLWKQGC